MPPKVMVVHNEGVIGGAERQLSFVVEDLVRSGVTITYVHGNTGIAKWLPAEVHCIAGRLGVPGGRLKGLGAVTAVSFYQRDRWQAILRQQQPDVVITTSFKEVVILSRITRAPVVWLLHSPIYQTTWRRLCRVFNRDLKRVVIYGAGTNVIASLRRLGLDAKLLPIRIDSRGPGLANRSIRQSIVIGYVGRINKAKNVAMLVRTVQILKTRKIDAQLLVFGEGDTKDKLSRLACRLGVADRVVVAGWKDNIVQALANDVDLLCYPSRDKGEARPAVIAEARLAGLPVVATSTGDIPTLAREDPCLHVVRPTPIGFADAVQHWGTLKMRMPECAEVPEWVQMCYRTDVFRPVREAVLGLMAGYSMNDKN